MSERTWLRSSLVIGALALGRAAVPSTARAQDAAKSDDANKQETAQPPPAPPTKDQELLTEIRDLLKAKGA